jgi:uncharacterized protein YndB with AHSA1/START domain
MPRVRRSSVIAAPAREVWDVLGDPHHLARWWPRARRVEDVRGDRFTLVLATERGRTVRADYAVAERQARRCVYRQQLAGTPFARFLAEAEIEASVDDADGGCAVTLELRQRPRGMARFGSFLMRRAALRQLEQALSDLEAICA